MADRRTLPTWVVEWCDPAITINHGRSGGTLDASAHLEQAHRRIIEETPMVVGEWTPTVEAMLMEAERYANQIDKGRSDRS